MKTSFFSLASLAAGFAVASFAAEPNDDDAKKKEEARPAVATDAGDKAAQTASPASKPADDAARTGANPVGTPKPLDSAANESPAADAPKPETPTVLPQVEVNKSRITNIDIEIQAQEKAMAREKANTKPTKLDNTLNNSKVSKALSIFGGSSSDSRSDLAKERISIMQEEKDLLESMKLARTKEEKAELQGELDALRATRRELELTPR